MIKMVGYDMAKAAADKVYEQTGLGPGDVQVVELHDCFTANEILTYEGLGLCGEGEAEKFIEDGDNTYGGRWSPTRRGACSRRATPSARRASRSAPSSCGSSRAGRQAPGAGRARRPAAQPRPRRGVCGDDVPLGVSHALGATGAPRALVRAPA
jgi:hypothetical protein